MCESDIIGYISCRQGQGGQEGQGDRALPRFEDRITYPVAALIGAGSTLRVHQQT